MKFTIFAALLLTLLAARHAAAADEVLLAADKQARLPIVVGQQASERTQAAAQTLADYLGRISGAAFTVTNGDGSAGLVVGVPGDFPKLPFKTAFPGGPRGREDYLLRSAAEGVWLLGASDLAVTHAVWDLLYRLGYRQFFPGRVWEVISVQQRLSIKVDASESPAFCSRRIWYNWGTLDYNAQPYADWCAKNRHAQGFRLNSGHSYEGIIGANKAEFDKHPEYYSLVEGRRRTGGDAKFCISNPGLRRLVVGWAARIASWAPRISGVLKDGAGNVVFDFGQSEDGWFRVPVPAGQDGKLWKFENSQGTRQLMTIPPYLARSGAELLLPSEVVERDAE